MRVHAVSSSSSVRLRRPEHGQAAGTWALSSALGPAEDLGELGIREVVDVTEDTGIR